MLLYGRCIYYYVFVLLTKCAWMQLLALQNAIVDGEATFWDVTGSTGHW